MNFKLGSPSESSGVSVCEGSVSEKKVAMLAAKMRENKKQNSFDITDVMFSFVCKRGQKVKSIKLVVAISGFGCFGCVFGKF